jgi:hypothetical protein
MTYIHTTTLAVESIDAIRATNPLMSIPDGADLTDLGYAKVEPTDPPVPGPWQRVVPSAPEQVGGQWVQGYTVENMGTAEIVAAVTLAVQQRLDDFARTHNYDGILSACTYATSTVPKFAAEGQYAVTARDATWATCYQIMGDVLQGLRPMPTLEQTLAELPQLEWPV